MCGDAAEHQWPRSRRFTRKVPPTYWQRRVLELLAVQPLYLKCENEKLCYFTVESGECESSPTVYAYVHLKTVKVAQKSGWIVGNDEDCYQIIDEGKAALRKYPFDASNPPRPTAEKQIEYLSYLERGCTIHGQLVGHPSVRSNTKHLMRIRMDSVYGLTTLAAMCGKADLKHFPSRMTSTTGPCCGMWNVTHCEPTWYDEVKTGGGQA